MSPRLEDIDIKDIAHHLGQVNRFNGAAIKPISVAQHSVFVSHLTEKFAQYFTPLLRLKMAKQGLLHDASEAYLGDVTKWVKQSPEMEAYRTIEDVVQGRILQRFECDTNQNHPHMLASEVILADRLMVRYEAIRGDVPIWERAGAQYAYLDPKEISMIDSYGWKFLSSDEAAALFIDRFAALAEG